MAFPPSKKSGGKNIAIGEHATVTQGKGGIPASLKVKNAGVKPAAFPKRVVEPADTDKTASVF